MKEKVRIMKTPPRVTEEEIKAFMDFDSLLAQKNKAVAARQKMTMLRNIFMALLGLLVIPIIIFWPQNGAMIPATHIAGDSLTEFETATPDSSASTPARASLPVSPEGIADNAEGQPAHQAPAKPKESGEKTAADDAPVYLQAEPLHGYPELYEYFNKNLRYPAAAMEDSTEGVVNVTFVVDVDGTPKNITIENSLGGAFDAEAVRLIEQMPAWRPASYNGKPVESKLSLPITFEIRNISKDPRQ